MGDQNEAAGVASHYPEDQASSVPFMSAYPRQNLGELYKDC